MGLAPSPPVAARKSRRASGARHTTQAATLSQIRPRRNMRSVVLLQIHSGVERGDLGVTVEHRRLSPAELSDPPLGGLTPARMVDVRVHVRVEAVLLRSGGVPGRLGLLVHETD